MVNIKIRECEKKDLPFVIKLMEELKVVARTENDFIIEDVEKIFNEMERNKDIYLNNVAAIDGKIVGFISVIFYKSFFHKGGTALINELIVKSDYRGKGIGRLLVDEVKREAIKRGMDELEVGTEKTNKKAQAFYRRCYFTEEYVLLGMEF